MDIFFIIYNFNLKKKKIILCHNANSESFFAKKKKKQPLIHPFMFQMNNLIEKYDKLKFDVTKKHIDKEQLRYVDTLTLRVVLKQLWMKH